jgi:hypothetical protein
MEHTMPDTIQQAEDRTLLYICEQLEPDIHRMHQNIDRLRRRWPNIYTHDEIIELARVAHRQGTNPKERAVRLVLLLKETYDNADASSGEHPDQGT